MPTVKSKDGRRHTAPKLRSLEPMYAAVGETLLERDTGLIETSATATARSLGEILAGDRSRGEKAFTDQFVVSARGCESLEPGTLLDGEIVDGAADLEHSDGR